MTENLLRGVRALLAVIRVLSAAFESDDCISLRSTSAAPRALATLAEPISVVVRGPVIADGRSVADACDAKT